MQPWDLFQHLCAMKLQTHFLLLSQGHLCRIRAHQLQQKGDSTQRHPRPLPEHLAVHAQTPPHCERRLDFLRGDGREKWVCFLQVQGNFFLHADCKLMHLHLGSSMRWGHAKKMQNLVSKQVPVFCANIYLNIMPISGLRDVISCASTSQLRRLGEPSLITDTEKAR